VLDLVEKPFDQVATRDAGITVTPELQELRELPGNYGDTPVFT
jgi:hypothetical protein